MVMNMRKIIFFDIDGTILDTSIRETSLLPQLLNKLIELKKQGNTIVACTARPKKFIDKYLPNIFDCMVLLNGSFVCTENQVLMDNPLSKGEIYQLNSYFDSINASYIYISNFSCWAYNISPRRAKLLDDIYMVGSGYTTFSSAESNKVYAIDLFFDNEDQYKRIYPLIKAKTSLNLNYHIGDFTGDISFEGRNKSYAIDHVLQHYQIDIKNAYAFGDGTNDINVFKMIPNTCAVGNASPLLKQVASIVSKKTIALGVLEGLEQWGF